MCIIFKHSARIVPNEVWGGGQVAPTYPEIYRVVVLECGGSARGCLYEEVGFSSKSGGRTSGTPRNSSTVEAPLLKL